MLPIESISLSYLKTRTLSSPICGYDYVAKILFEKTFDRAAAGDVFTLHKWTIDPTIPEVAEHLEALGSSSPFMNYMTACKYMSHTIYMGGLYLEEELSAIHEIIDITPILLAGRDFVLDPVVDTDLITCYNIQYSYGGTCYSTDYVGSYVPILAEQYHIRLRPCISNRNLRYRGVNESFKYDNSFREISNDLYYLEGREDALNLMSDTLLPSEDVMLQLFDLQDKIFYMVEAQ